MRTFQYNDHNLLDFENDIDPKKNSSPTLTRTAATSEKLYNQTIKMKIK